MIKRGYYVSLIDNIEMMSIRHVAISNLNQIYGLHFEREQNLPQEKQNALREKRHCIIKILFGIIMQGRIKN